MSSKQLLVYDGNMQVDFIVQNVSGRVPPEIWVKIFKLLPEPRNLTTFREVCKLWQAVIDDNFDMKVKINDDKMNVCSIIHFKRVTQCIVSKFLREDIPLLSSPPPSQLFWDPKILSSLIIRGTISRPNFFVIAQQCENVKQLFLTGFVLVGDTKLFEAESPEETNILTKFMSGLQKLVVNGLHIGSSESDPTPVNLFSLLNWPMAELKDLVVRVSYPDASEDKKFFQLLENCRNLETIEFTRRSYRVPLLFTPFVLPNLTTLNFEVRIQDRLGDWLPFISAQNTIKNLKIVISHDEGFELDQHVVEAILKNETCLECLEMRKLCKIYHRINAQFFRGMVNLKSLILQGVKQPKIYYLNLLPVSMETLVLENFEVKRQQFELIVDRVANVKTRNINLA